MLKLLLACAVLTLLFCLLCGPVLYVALRFRQRGDRTALRPLRFVWLAQVALAAGLVMVADGARLGNPVGAMLAIAIGVSLGGASLFGLWRFLLRLAVRQGLR